jgi:hypothetical protein
MTDPLSIVPQRRNLSMWLSPGNNTLSEFDGVDDAKAYNKCDQMSLFTDFIKKIGVVKKKLTPRHIAIGTKRCEVENSYDGGD